MIILIFACVLISLLVLFLGVRFLICVPDELYHIRLALERLSSKKDD